jgi:hypothetical protein
MFHIKCSQLGCSPSKGNQLDDEDAEDTEEREG